MIPVHPNSKALLFDLDGTLVDTMPLHWKTFHEVFIENGFECPQNVLDPLAGVPIELIFEIINKKLAKNIDPIKASKRKQELFLAQLDSIKGIEPVITIVQKFYQKLPLAVVSGGAKIAVEKSLKAVGLLDYFATIITADDPIKPKPAPDIFLEAAKRLRIEPQFCQVFEDAPAGIAAAKIAGMIVTDVREFI